MSDVMPNDEPAVPPAPQLPTSQDLAQGIAICWRTNPYTSRRGLHEFYEATDDRLLGISCACDWGRLYLERLALHGR